MTAALVTALAAVGASGCGGDDEEARWYWGDTEGFDFDYEQHDPSGCVRHPEQLGVARVGHAATGRTRMRGGLRMMSIASSHRSLSASARM